MQKISGIILVIAAIIAVECAPSNSNTQSRPQVADPRPQFLSGQTRPSNFEQLGKFDRSDRHARSSPDATEEHADTKVQPVKDSENKDKTSSDELLKIDHIPSKSDSDSKINQQAHPALLGSTVQRPKRDTNKHGINNKHDARNSHLTSNNNRKSNQQGPPHASAHLGGTRDIPKSSVHH